ncbi:MAG: HipA N-terminal domain-containing protein [Bacteroidota bacterium]
MRKAKVKYKGEESGWIIQEDDGSFIFKYNDQWFNNPQKPAISLNLSKDKQLHKSDFLFPFFYNMLPEGTNKQIIRQYEKIDKEDYFGLLLISARFDSIGAITVESL